MAWHGMALDPDMCGTHDTIGSSGGARYRICIIRNAAGRARAKGSAPNPQKAVNAGKRNRPVHSAQHRRQRRRHRASRLGQETTCLGSEAEGGGSASVAGLRVLQPRPLPVFRPKTVWKGGTTACKALSRSTTRSNRYGKRRAFPPAYLSSSSQPTELPSSPARRPPACLPGCLPLPEPDHA